jgi:peptide alpha-N-acetyltransferase
MSKALATPAKRALPSKEASLFKELLTLYETKQLRKGQKTADQILKKFPEHGGATSALYPRCRVLKNFVL